MSTITLDSKIPGGPLADKWTNFKAASKLVSPANKRRYELIIVGSGLAGGSAAAVASSSREALAISRPVRSVTIV